MYNMKKQTNTLLLKYLPAYSFLHLHGRIVSKPIVTGKTYVINVSASDTEGPLSSSF